ncbi:MAG: cyclase family protein [Clostridia bacterium]
MSMAPHVSPFGPDDRLGAANYVTEREVLRALSLVKEGRIVDLSLAVGVDSPRIPGINSPFVISMWSHPLVSQIVHFERGSRNGVAFADERIEFDTHTGTHIDALGHTSARGKMYNGVPVSEAVGNHGLSDLDAGKIPPLLTRGVLLDIVTIKGRFLDPGEPIEAADLEEAEALVPGGVQAGDIALVRTGWARHYGVDNLHYAVSAPGITEGASSWLADRQVAAVAGDTMSIEVTPFVDPANSDPVHLNLLVRRGVYMIEQCNLEPPEIRGREFLCCCLAPRFAGATGSPLRLVAVL